MSLSNIVKFNVLILRYKNLVGSKNFLVRVACC
jgi:hypothetical protein